ncbi:hypothetical protein [Sutcliffiella deserti]|uniref:hypothetical protein n=1 Tax=Sutcliffiella deserti TaxID=2875501 RepID=UPI001CBF20AB|nr:hypothetical protein [Sutcliffiella deserti]
MIIDFYTLISNETISNKDQIIAAVKRAKENQLTALVLAKEFISQNIDNFFDYLDTTEQYFDDYYFIEGIKVFSAIEVITNEIGKVLMVGSRYDLKTFNYFFREYQQEGEKVPLLELDKISKTLNFIMICEHPLKKNLLIDEKSEELVKTFHCCVIDERNFKDYGLPKLVEIAAKYRLPVIAGGGELLTTSYGEVVNVLERDCETINEIKEILKEGLFNIEMKD